MRWSQGQSQHWHLFHKYLEAINFVLLFWQAFHSRDPIQGQVVGVLQVAVDLGRFPNSEVNCLCPLIQGDVEHGILLSFGELHLLLLQCFNQWLNLIKICLPSQQAHFLEVLREVQVGSSQEVQDVAEHFAISVNEAVALAIPLGWHLSTEHGAQHGVWKTSQGRQGSGVQFSSNVEGYRF
uniref:Uncharacterized protein n=1 Tax=Gopherus agassizii TaxID=38772 RepID=A0A452IV14_9SAUR